MIGFDILAIAVVIFVQIYVFVRTYAHITALKEIFPNTTLSLKKVAFTIEERNSLSANKLTERINQPVEEDALESLFIQNELYVDLIEPRRNHNSAFKNILSATNHYLLRNKNHAADFRIIKEIAERKIEALENQIEATINLPLYLGLLGTIIGIVLGLFHLYPSSSVVDSNLIANLENEIPKLLGGVAIAMTASFAGLLLTIISNGTLYKSAINQCDQLKSKYFSFIQTELLPILAHDTKNSIEELKDTLNKFNSVIKKTIKEEFSDSVKVLNSGIGEMNTAVSEIVTIQKLQHQSIAELNKVDFTSMVNMFENIKTSGQELNKGFVAQKQLLEYIYESLEQIKKKEKDTRSFIAELDNTFKKAAEVLSDSAKGEMRTFKSYVADEKNILQKAIERNRPEFTQLNHLEAINKKLDQVEIFNQMNGKFDLMIKQMENGNNVLVQQVAESNKELILAIHVKDKLNNGLKMINSEKIKETTEIKQSRYQTLMMRLRKLLVK